MGFQVLQDGSWTSSSVNALTDNGWTGTTVYTLSDGSWVQVGGGDGGDGGDGGEGGDGDTGSQVELNSDSSTLGVTAEQGLEVVPNTSLDGLSVRISDEPSGYSEAILHDADAGQNVATVDVSRHANGDWVDFNASLSESTTYYALLWANGSEYTRGRGSASYPYSTDDFDVTQGIYTIGGSSTTSYRYNFDAVASITSDSGSDPTLYIDHFAHDDLSTYYDISDSSGTASIHSEAVYPPTDGGYALELNGFVSIFSGPWNDLDNYPEQGYEWRLWFNPRTSNDTDQFWFLFGGDDRENCYRVEYIGTGSLRLRKLENGSADTLDGTYDHITWENRWYQLTVRWYNSSFSGQSRDGFTAYLHEADYNNWDEHLFALDSGENETTYTGEGLIGYRSSANGAIYIDDVTKHSFD